MTPCIGKKRYGQRRWLYTLAKTLLARFLWEMDDLKTWHDSEKVGEWMPRQVEIMVHGLWIMGSKRLKAIINSPFHFWTITSQEANSFCSQRFSLPSPLRHLVSYSYKYYQIIPNSCDSKTLFQVTKVHLCSLTYYTYVSWVLLKTPLCWLYDVSKKVQRKMSTRLKIISCWSTKISIQSIAFMHYV